MDSGNVIGFKYVDGSIQTANGPRKCLAALNDAGAVFERIASIIETEPALYETWHDDASG